MSRTRNGSSLKRPLGLTPQRIAQKTPNNKSGGHFRTAESARMPRETGNPKGPAEVIASIRPRVRAVHRIVYGIYVVFASFSAADLRCAQRQFGLLRPRPARPTSRWSRGTRQPAQGRDRRAARSDGRAAAVRAATRNRSEPPKRRRKPTAPPRSSPAERRSCRRWSPSCAAPTPAAASSNASPPASISNRRASRWPASWPSARSSPIAPNQRPLPVILLRRAVPAQPILLHPRQRAAVGAAGEPAMADRGRDRQDRRPGPEGFGGRQGPVLPRALRLAAAGG